MTNRSARNIEYRKFLTSVSDEDDSVACNKLEIPEFQRNYVWKPSNIKDVFSSIKENDKNYYLGNIVVIKSVGGRDKIVDGQQRLVSLSLIAKQLIEKTSDVDKKNDLKKIIWADTGNSIVRILFQKDNLKEFYNTLIQGLDFDESDLDKTQEVLLKSFASIKKELEIITNIDDFIEKFLSLEFVVIASLSDEDAYQLFEGLNSTGLSLSAVELTKNSILGKIKSLDNTRIEEAVEIWSCIEKKFEDVNIIWFNKFLRHQWFFKEGYVSNPDLFRNIKLKIINKEGVTVENLFDYLEELKRDSSIYISFRTANLNKADFNLGMSGNAWISVNNMINFIGKLNLDQVYSVLLALYKYGTNEESYFRRGETFQKHIYRIWQFLLIAKYTKISPSSFERDFSGVCKGLQGLSYDDFKVKIDAFFCKLSLKISDLRDDFSVNMSDSIDYFVDDRGLIRFILEEYLITEGEGSDKDIETEHIIPENNIENWTEISDRDNFKKFVGKLGNLTLLNRTLNGDAGNKNFDNKFDIAYSKSRFTVNNSLKDDWGDRFNSNDPFGRAVIPRGCLIGGIIYDKYYGDMVI